jgi:hypothetical protein
MVGKQCSVGSGNRNVLTRINTFMLIHVYLSPMVAKAAEAIVTARVGERKPLLFDIVILSLHATQVGALLFEAATSP